MTSLQGKNVLICCNLKKERVLFFSYFDNNESEMIYTAKDVKGCADILLSESIDYLVIESSNDLIKTPEQLYTLIKGYPSVQTVVLINNESQVSNELYNQFQQVANMVLFNPISELEIGIKISQFFCNSERLTIKEQPVFETNKTKDNLDSEQELWNAFFNDSLLAKIIIDAKTKKIIKVNEQLSNLLQLREPNIIGQSWDFMDDKANRGNYQNYINEINSKEKTHNSPLSICSTMKFTILM